VPTTAGNDAGPDRRWFGCSWADACADVGRRVGGGAPSRQGRRASGGRRRGPLAGRRPPGAPGRARLAQVVRQSGARGERRLAQRSPFLRPRRYPEGLRRDAGHATGRAKADAQPVGRRLPSSLRQSRESGGHRSSPSSPWVSRCPTPWGDPPERLAGTATEIFTVLNNGLEGWAGQLHRRDPRRRRDRRIVVRGGSAMGHRRSGPIQPEREESIWDREIANRFRGINPLDVTSRRGPRPPGQRHPQSTRYLEVTSAKVRGRSCGTRSCPAGLRASPGRAACRRPVRCPPGAARRS
jgi:hypothetical protein